MPPGKQHMGDTHRVWVWEWDPARLWGLPQLQVTTRTWRPRSGRAHALPVPSSLQIPSVSLTSTCTFFLGKILGQLPNTLLCALFLPRAVTTRPHGMAGDGDLPQSKYKYLGFPNGHTTSAGHTGKSRPGSHPGSHCWSQCHQLPLVLIPPHGVPQPARAVLDVAPSAFWGESLIFQGKLDTQGLTLITGSGH